MSRNRSLRKEFSFFHPETVRWGDMDALGHVNNANYFRYTESARVAFFAQLFAGEAGFMREWGPILAHIGCDYHVQLHYPATLAVAVGIESISRRSLVMRCPIFRDGEDSAVADVRAVIVWFDYARQQAAPVPQRLRNYLIPAAG